MRARFSAFLLLLLLAFPAHAMTEDPLEEVRRIYLEAVEASEAIARGLEAVAALRAAGTVTPGSAADATLDAYRGALLTLRAKHATWPPTRLRHLREGLEVLDAVLEAHPDHAEARYLRLMSCFYLPRVLGRGWSVREDFAALGRLLPGVRDAYPPELYAAIVTFVLENGRVQGAERRALEDALARARDG